MIKKMEKERIVRIIDSIKHQDIGGKKIRIEKEGTISDILDTNLNLMSIAMSNFMFRRNDFFNLPEEMKIYYGHELKSNLGYFIAEDEIVEEFIWQN